MVVQYARIESRIPTSVFLFDEECKESPIEFKLKFLVDDNIYDLNLVLDQDQIIFEKLTMENSSSLHLLYERREDKFVFGKKLANNEALKFVAKGTNKNRLFLSNTIDQQMDVFADVFNWFSNLLLLTPEGKSIPILPLDDRQDHEETLNRFIGLLDTGIEEIYFKEVNFERLNLPKELKDSINSTFNNKNIDLMRLSSSDNSNIYILKRIQMAILLHMN